MFYIIGALPILPISVIKTTSGNFCYTYVKKDEVQA